MATVKVKFISGMQYEAEARGHRVVCDQPVEAGGGDRGMTPPEFLLASLGTCTMYYAAEYFRKHQIPAVGMTVEVEASKAANPPRLSKFQVTIEVPGVTEERHLEGARRSAERCLVKNTLLAAPEIQLSVRAGQAVA